MAGSIMSCISLSNVANFSISFWIISTDANANYGLKEVRGFTMIIKIDNFGKS